MQTAAALFAMIVVFAVMTILRRVPVPVTLLVAAVAGMLAAGFWFPLRHVAEGSLLFLYLMLIIAMGMIFMAVMKESGGLDALTRLIILRLSRHPSIMLAFLMLLIMFPAMLTGSAPAAVLTTGVLVAPILMRMGIPKLETAAIIGFGATLGIPAPPINVPAMIIATGVYAPYQGFDLILLVMTIPPAIFTVLYLARKHVRVFEPSKLLEGLFSIEGKTNVLIHLPVVVVLVLMIGPRVLPGAFPDFGTPLVFLIGSIVGIFTGKRFNFFTATKSAMTTAMPMLAIFVGVGILVQAMSLTGVRGLLVVSSLALPAALLYVAIVIATPLLGGPLMPFGVASVLGVPLVLAFMGKNTIAVISGITLIMSLGAMVPPTAISGAFAAQVVDEKDYRGMLKKCVVPTIVTIAIGVLVLVFSDWFGKILT